MATALEEWRSGSSRDEENGVLGRMLWTDAAEELFVAAVERAGGMLRCSPRDIHLGLQKSMPGITYAQVKSHLQRCRTAYVADLLQRGEPVDGVSEAQLRASRVMLCKRRTKSEPAFSRRRSLPAPPPGEPEPALPARHLRLRPTPPLGSTGELWGSSSTAAAAAAAEQPAASGGDIGARAVSSDASLRCAWPSLGPVLSSAASGDAALAPSGSWPAIGSVAADGMVPAAPPASEPAEPTTQQLLEALAGHLQQHEPQPPPPPQQEPQPPPQQQLQQVLLEALAGHLQQHEPPPPPLQQQPQPWQQQPWQQHDMFPARMPVAQQPAPPAPPSSAPGAAELLVALLAACPAPQQPQQPQQPQLNGDAVTALLQCLAGGGTQAVPSYGLSPQVGTPPPAPEIPSLALALQGPAAGELSALLEALARHQ